jgi:hypothetical protein
MCRGSPRISRCSTALTPLKPGKIPQNPCHYIPKLITPIEKSWDCGLNVIKSMTHEGAKLILTDLRHLLPPCPRLRKSDHLAGISGNGGRRHPKAYAEHRSWAGCSTRQRRQGSLRPWVFPILLGLGVLSLAFAGCAKPPSVGSPTTAVGDTPIGDLTVLSQDCNAYLNPATANIELIAPDSARQLTSRFKDRHFAPWHRTAPHYSPQEAFRGFQRFAAQTVFGENKCRRDSGWLDDLRLLAGMESYPDTNRPAITIVNTRLRLLPTDKPAFYDFDAPGEGYPFDHLQESAVWSGTPVFVAHTSMDGAWVLAEVPFAGGWIPVEDIAFTDAVFMEAFETDTLVAFVKDGTPVSSDDRVFRFVGRLGAVLPLSAAQQEHLEVLAPAADLSRRAVARRARISRQDAVIMPLAATPRHFAALINILLGQPYGWGGLYGNRDCSATLKDLFTPFGIWLPRNSPEQARQGIFIALRDLDPGQKEQMILDKGIPFLTEIWLPGHIMLYIGNHLGKPLVFHNTWGLKTQNADGGESRKIIGKAVITTLEPGKELPELSQPKGNLLYRIEAMTLLGHPWQVQERSRTGALR